MRIQVFRDCFYRIMEQKYSLLSHNTFGIDVSAACFLEYASVDELRGLIGSGRVTSPYLHIGGGSNLLFTKDYEGTILHSRIGGVEVVAETDDDIVVRVGAGVVWDDFVDYCVQRHWYGVENLSLIPGEVGASAVQNIGAYGCEAKDAIRRVEMYCVETGNLLTLDAAHCGFGYRESVFKHDLKGRVIITAIEIRLSHTPRPKLGYGDVEREVEARGGATLRNIREAICSIRRAKLPDPAVLGNAGSFFKNPVVEAPVAERLLAEYPDMPHYAAPEGRIKLAAGWLIDRAGMKGYREGSVGVHERQALVLVNHGGATGGEVIAFARTVQAKVREKFGIEIDTEVNIL